MFEHDFNKFPELSNVQMQELYFTSPHVQYTRDFIAKVVKVHDGDTVTLTTYDRDFEFPLRLLNIDAAELSEGGKVAKEWLSNRVLGELVEIQILMSNRVGKYGRLLGKIIHNGLDVGNEEIYQGISKAFGKKKEGEVPDIEKFFSIKQWL